MKSFSVFLLGTLFIFIESGVKCEAPPGGLLPLNNLCIENDECESKFCKYLPDIDKKFCVENDTSDHDSEISKVERGTCTYLKSDHVDGPSREALIGKYTQFHAAHALLPTGTKVIVTRGNKTVTVVIDSRTPSKGSSSSNLELSDEAANALDIWTDSSVDCDLEIDESPDVPSFVSFVVKPVAVVVVYLAAVVLSSYW